MNLNEVSYRGHSISLTSSGYLAVDGKEVINKDVMRNVAQAKNYIDNLIEAAEAREAAREQQERDPAKKPVAPVLDQTFWVRDRVRKGFRPVRISSAKRSTSRYSHEVEQVYGEFQDGKVAKGRWAPREVYLFKDEEEIERFSRLEKAGQLASSAFYDFRRDRCYRANIVSNSHVVHFREHDELDLPFVPVLGSDGEDQIWLTSDLTPRGQFESYYELGQAVTLEAFKRRGIVRTSDDEWVMAADLDEYERLRKASQEASEESFALLRTITERTQKSLMDFMGRVERYRSELADWKDGAA
jgi:hypothetical protein